MNGQAVSEGQSSPQQPPPPRRRLLAPECLAASLKRQRPEPRPPQRPFQQVEQRENSATRYVMAAATYGGLINACKPSAS